MDKDRELSRVPNPRGRIRRKKFVPANRRQGISAGFCAPQTRADASAAQNSFPPTVGNEFPPVLACSRPARTYPPRKIRSRQPLARNFRRFLRSPNPCGRIRRAKFSFPQTGGNEFPPVSACSKPARTHLPHEIRSRQPAATNFRRFLCFPKLRGKSLRPFCLS